MRFIDLGEGRQVSAYLSRGVNAKAVLRADQVAVTLLEVAAGGEIGSHPAVVDQLFVVLSGSGEVRGAEGRWHRIEAGQAVLWSAGEQHTTRAREGLTALAVEMPDLPSPGG